MKSALIPPFIARHQPAVTAGGSHRLEANSALEPLWAPVVIRLATAGDRRSLDYLAQLDSAELPSGALLIGELRGRPVVAVSLSDGSAIADPFLPTSDLLALVRLRAGQLTTRSARPRSTA